MQEKGHAAWNYVKKKSEVELKNCPYLATYIWNVTDLPKTWFPPFYKWRKIKT